MQLLKLILLSIILALIAACASTGSNHTKDNSNHGRKEIAEEADKNSAEMMNVQLGVGYLQRGKEGDIKNALKKFKHALEINPKFALAHSMLANTYDRMGLFDSAQKHYKLSYKYNNDNPDITNNYANFLCQRGKYKESIALYEEVVNNPQYKTPASAYENAGVCAKEGRDQIKAEQFFRKALEINPKSPNSLYFLMNFYLESNNYMKARAFLQRLEQVVNPSAEMLTAGYTIEKALKHNDLAENYLQKLQKQYPRSKAVQKIQEENNK